MERMENDPIHNGMNPMELGRKFNSEDFFDFVANIRQIVKADPSIRISIVTDWAGVEKARAAKALLDQHATRLHIDSFTIRATRKQYEEDVNAFESGVKWEEIQ